MNRREMLQGVGAAFAAMLAPATRAGIPKGFTPPTLPAAPDAVSLFMDGVRVPNELLSDQMIDGLASCHERFARAMAERIDRQFFESTRTREGE
jgi:hypothetical protein